MEALQQLYDWFSQSEVFMELIGGFLIGTALLRGVQVIAEIGIKATKSKGDDLWYNRNVKPVLRRIYFVSGLLNSWKKPPTL